MLLQGEFCIHVQVIYDIGSVRMTVLPLNQTLADSDIAVYLITKSRFCLKFVQEKTACLVTGRQFALRFWSYGLRPKSTRNVFIS